MRMSFILTVILFSVTTLLTARENIRKAVYEDKEYFVYPYKYSTSYSYYNFDGTYSTQAQNEASHDIAPYPGNLPDGDYIMYYDPQLDYKKVRRLLFFKKYKRYYDTTKVAAVFTIKNNKKEGHARFLSKYGMLQVEGEFINDEQEGIWKNFIFKNIKTDHQTLNDPENARRRYNTTDYDSETYYAVIEEYEYKNGIKEGKFRTYIKNYDDVNDTSRIVEHGFYKDNKPYNLWKIYFTNSKLAVEYSITDSIGEPLLYTETARNQYRTLWVPAYHGWYTEYYSNGQLKHRTHYKNGYKSQLDTGYYYNGKTKWMYYSYEKMRDTIKDVYDEYKSYDTTGAISSHFINRNGMVFNQKYYFSGKLSSEYFYDIYFNVKNKDTLVPVEISYKWDENGPINEPSEITYKHLETGIKLVRNFDHDNFYSDDEMDDFVFISDTTSDIYYVQEIIYQGRKKELEVHTFKHYYRGPFYFFYHSYSSSEDSSKLVYENKMFTGKYKHYIGSWRKKQNKVKAGNNKIKYYSDQNWGENYYGGLDFGYSSKNANMFIGDYRRRGIRFRFLRRIFSRKVLSSEYGAYVDGSKQGEWIIRKKKKGVIFEKNNYHNGLLQGKQYAYEIEYIDRWSDCKDVIDKNIAKKKGLFGMKRYYLYDLSDYNNNEKNGTQYSYHCNGRIETKSEYENNYLHGKYEAWDDEGNLVKSTGYDHDYYNGSYKEWTSTGKLRYDASFEEGIAVGEYKYYFFNGKLAEHGKLENGYRVGDWITYFEDGQVKFKETYRPEDSSYFIFGGSSYGYHSKRPENFSHTLSSCYSKQFYPTGTMAAEGKIKGGQREGIWKFYDEGGVLVKQINYEPGKIELVMPNGKTDTLEHFGYYESWYADGNKQSEAYVLEETGKFDCYQQVKISMQDLLYLNYWDKSGEQTIKDKTGRLQSYHLMTGKTESEGEFINGMKTGYWRYWDPEGKLNAVGNYVNNEQDGKWLFGDLEGMHYLDDACFDISDQRVVEEMKMKKKKLTINEVVFKRGRIIKQSNFNVDLNKFEED